MLHYIIGISILFKLLFVGTQCGHRAIVDWIKNAGTAAQ